MSLALTPKRAVLAPGQWARNELWRRARAVPSLDLRFADNKSLSDAVTGQSLVTFTRASSGTYVGSDGLIKTATTNLLLRSEEFDNASWTKSNASITANAALAPDGFNTADKLIEDIATNTHLVQPSSSPSWTSGTSYTYSVYAKSAERTFVQLRVTAGNTYSASFDLTAGVASQLAAGTTAQITGLASSWYRISITFTASATATGAARIGLMTNATTSGYTGDGTSGLYIWGAQLEQSSTVGEYIPTTSTINSAPRFDHNPTTRESLGLLVEEQRTNNHLRSEDLANWGTPSAATVSSDATTAPDGTLTADKLVETTSNAGHFLSSGSLSFSYTSGTTYTRSCWLKAAGRTFASLYLPATNFPSAGRTAVFNLSTGAVASAESGVTAAITAFANGWYRCVISAAATSTGSGHSGGTALYSDATISAYTGDGTSGVFVWGAQLETGSFPTSYIPTTTATVTRSADVASITGANFSSWYRQDEGTVFASSLLTGTSTSRELISISDGTANNSIILRWASGSQAQFSVTTAGINQVSISPAGYSNLGQLYSRAAGYKLDNFAQCIDGILVGTDSSGTVAVLDRIFIGANGTGTPGFTGTIRRLTYWPQRLPNSTLQAVTQ